MVNYLKVIISCFCLILNISVYARVLPPAAAPSQHPSHGKGDEWFRGPMLTPMIFKHGHHSGVHFGPTHRVALKVVFGLLMGLVAFLVLFLWLTRGYARTETGSGHQPKVGTHPSEKAVVSDTIFIQVDETVPFVPWDVEMIASARPYARWLLKAIIRGCSITLSAGWFWNHFSRDPCDVIKK